MVQVINNEVSKGCVDTIIRAMRWRSLQTDTLSLRMVVNAECLDWGQIYVGWLDFIRLWNGGGQPCLVRAWSDSRPGCFIFTRFTRSAILYHPGYSYLTLRLKKFPCIYEKIRIMIDILCLTLEAPKFIILRCEGSKVSVRTVKDFLVIIYSSVLCKKQHIMQEVYRW